MKVITFESAIKILNRGGIVIFPTDTAFGVGCRIDNTDSIQRLFNIRKRPLKKATPVLVSSIEMAKDYLAPLSNIVRRLMTTYWPGALTIVYKCKTNKVPLPVRGGGENLGVRMPNHPLILKMIEKIGVPILGPSANFYQAPTPYYFEDLDPDFIKLTDGVVKGSSKIHNVSTVIDCTKRPFSIIRQGAEKVKEEFLK